MKRFTEYDDFAEVYNQHWSDFAYRVLPILERLALADLPPGAALLDLCCGTGQLARLLTDRGHVVTGLDGSEAMLRYARENAPNAAFVCADARAFELPTQFAAAVSTYDSLNHIMKLADLEQVFANVFRHLQPGGVLVFDMNLESGYASRWEGQSNIVSGHSVVAMHSMYDVKEKVATAWLTLFTRYPEDMSLWRRKSLFLSQRAYSVEELTGALASAGFVSVNLFDARRDFGWREEGRAFFRARKA